MTVQELIDRLEKMPRDRTVVASCYGTYTKLPNGEFDGDNLMAFDIEDVFEGGPWDDAADAACIDLWFTDPDREGRGIGHVMIRHPL